MTADTPSPTPQPSSPRTAVIGASIRINGELQADEDLSIEGSFTGTLLIRNNLLSVGAKGQIKGSALAKSIQVEGHIEGDLYATERISIRKGARVKGTVMSPRVSLEDGAVLRGTVEMDQEAIKEAIQAQFGKTETSSTPAASPAPAPKPATDPAARGPAPVTQGNKPTPDKEQPSKDSTPTTAVSGAR